MEMGGTFKHYLDVFTFYGIIDFNKKEVLILNTYVLICKMQQLRAFSIHWMPFNKRYLNLKYT